MDYKYGRFTPQQMAAAKQYMRKKIYFLLVCVDPETSKGCKDVDVPSAFDNILREFGGLNELLFNPPELVQVMSSLEAALLEYKSQDFEFQNYRRLVLDAGARVLRIKEV